MSAGYGGSRASQCASFLLVRFPRKLSLGDTMQISIQFIRLKEVQRLRARGKSSTYQDIANGVLTKPVALGGGRSVAWPLHEIDTLNAALLSGKSTEEIQQIVQALHIALQGVL